MSVDLRILAFALAVSVLTGLLFSLAPVFQNSRSRIRDALKFLESFLFGVTSHDAPTLSTVAVALTLVGLVACYFPARRAARTDPVTTLRSE